MTPEEEIARLIETRSELLGMIGRHKSSHPVGSGEQVHDLGTELTDLKRDLAEVDGYLAEAGLSFGP